MGRAAAKRPDDGPSTSGQPGTSAAGMPRTDTSKSRDNPVWMRARQTAPLSACSAIVCACGASSAPRASASKPPGCNGLAGPRPGPLHSEADGPLSRRPGPIPRRAASRAVRVPAEGCGRAGRPYAPRHGGDSAGVGGDQPGGWEGAPGGLVGHRTRRRCPRNRRRGGVLAAGRPGRNPPQGRGVPLMRPGVGAGRVAAVTAGPRSGARARALDRRGRCIPAAWKPRREGLSWLRMR